MKIDVKAILANLWQKIKNFRLQDCRVSFVQGMKNLEANGRSLFVTVIAAVIVMGLVCLAVFFATVKGPEKVLVPQVEGKDLTQALLEMQVKELYPKIQLRYDEQPSGTILNQSPDAGAIVKAGTRVTLTVSRGEIVKEVGNYIGKNFDEVKIDLTTMFTGSSRQLIVLAEPVYKADLSEAGTILEQDPPEGTKISDPVAVQLVVSRGPNFDNTKIPKFIGKSIQEILPMLSETKLVIDFTARKAEAGEKEGTAVAQSEDAGLYLPNNSRLEVELVFPVKPEDDLVYGLFETKLPEYPYPVAMTVECVQKNGQRNIIASMNHTGGNFTVPYAVDSDSELILRVAGREAKRINVNK